MGSLHVAAQRELHSAQCAGRRQSKRTQRSECGPLTSAAIVTGVYDERCHG